MNVNEKLAVLMEFNGYTKDELEAYLSLKFGSMTKGGMTASILSQSGYEKAKSVIFGQPQLNENQQKWINRLTINYSWYGGTAQHALHATLQEPEMPDLPQNEFAQVLKVFSRWVQEQEEE